MKTAILFFGLTRSLSYTYPAFKEKLFDVLTKNNIEYDIFIHTYFIHGEYKNIWSSENITNYNNEEYKLLNAKHVLMDIQDDIIEEHNFEDYYSNLGNWTGMSPELTKYLIRNMVLALYSKKQITLLFEKHKDEYDNVIIIRPDLYLHSYFDVQWFNEIDHGTIITPEKERFGGANDRLVILKPENAVYYGTLYDLLLEYSRRKSIVSENYLLDMLTLNNISISLKDIQYDTIRAR